MEAKTDLVREALPPQSFRRFTVKEYHRLIETGFLDAEDRVELLGGWLINKMPHNPPHDATVTRIDRRLTRLLPDEWIIRCQCAATLLDSEPEPDIVVVPGPEETWFERHPGPKDILLVIEVADASLARDRTVKAEIYARAHIPVYWIVNLTDNWIEEYTQPRGGKNAGYRKRQDLRKGNVIAIPIPDLETDTVPVSELLR